MDLILDGKGPEELAHLFAVSPEEIGAQYRRAFFPEEPYRPWGRRKARAGMKMTALELKIIKKHQEAGVPVAHTAKMLQRKPGEICPDYYGKITFNQMRCFAPITDQLIAHHYLFHVSKTPIISDQAYDDAKAEEIEFGGGGEWLHLIAASEKKVCDYPSHIRSLAYYMLHKFMEVTGEWNDRVLPYSWGLERKAKQ